MGGHTTGRAVAVGGPLDGSELGDDAPPVYEVVTADGRRHRYRRSEVREPGATRYHYAGLTDA